MTSIVRQATPADIDTICAYNAFLAAETEGKELDPELLRRGVAAVLGDAHKGSYLLAEEAGQVQGQVMVTYEWSDWRAGWFWWLQSVYVTHTARRRGIFRLLLSRVQELARADPSVIGVRLYVERENQAAHAVYRKLGLETTPYLVMEQYPL